MIEVLERNGNFASKHYIQVGNAKILDSYIVKCPQDFYEKPSETEISGIFLPILLIGNYMLKYADFSMLAHFNAHHAEHSRSGLYVLFIVNIHD